MLSRLTAEMMSEVFGRALREGLIRQEDTSVIFYDLSCLEERIAEIIRVFPRDTLHAVAIKANPLTQILRLVTKQGAGLEAASLPELYLAEKTGLPPDMIVFDSPAKTDLELRYALNLGMHINADSLEELRRIAVLQAKQVTGSTIGIRINPQVGTGTILTTSVAGDYSKFGVPITEKRRELIRSFLDYSWLRGVHLHIGSQGCPVELLLKGVATVIDFVNEVNQNLSDSSANRQVEILDIGGGFPVAYSAADTPVSMQQYCERLTDLIRNCSSRRLRLVTEFGRYVHANAGWFASRVEYVKRSSGVDTVIIHAGADLFLRKCYKPDDWHHDISVVDRNGRFKTGGNLRKYAIAGPLCFAGDMIARQVDLPPIEEGDFILIHDTGAYTLSMWSRYNSRQIPRVLGYRNRGTAFEILKERETPEDLRRFWS